METKNMTRLEKIIYHKTNELNHLKKANKILTDYIEKLRRKKK